MITKVDPRLIREVTEFRLRYSCEACVHFVAEDERCAHEYPVEQHREVAIEQRRVLVFCKEYELG